MCTGVDFPVSPQGSAGVAGSCGKGESAPQHTSTCAAPKEPGEPCGLEGVSEVGLESSALLTANSSHDMISWLL